MSENIIIALLSLVGTLAGTFAGIMATSKLSNYRIGQLEEKVEKHNQIVDRTYILEKHSAVIDEEIKVVNHRIDDLEEFHK